MAVKYFFVTGGVVSGLGKGITAASLGRLLKARGYKVHSQKFDPYLNMDPGTMNPVQHGEVLHDAYISVVEALKHGAVAHDAEVDIRWVDSELVTKENVRETFRNVHGIIVPGGFGDRGIEGMIESIRYAREQKIPYLGICLGMQLTIVEFARNVLGYTDANSSEFNPSALHQVIHIMPDQNGITDLGGTLRLGSYPCVLDKTSKSYQLYDTETITERHRHRYEVNNDYRDALAAHGMRQVGHSPDGHIVEMVELENHPWFIGTQAHPEFKSRPNKAHPLFKGFLGASLEHLEQNP